MKLNFKTEQDSSIKEQKNGCNTVILHHTRPEKKWLIIRSCCTFTTQEINLIFIQTNQKQLCLKFHKE